LAALRDDRKATHWVAAPATHLYSGPDIKEREHAALSQGARLTIAKEHSRFFETDDGLFVPRRHLRTIGDWLDDPAAVAEGYLGTPYLWGGNSRTGIDCSGLVQASLLACGIPCPGDSDLQLAALSRELPPGSACQRSDLLFWPGHVAMAVDGQRMIHANAFNMAVTYEDIAAATARIAAQGEGSVLAVKRL
jgi:cell wall-associated NlpC family hydrolase